VIVARSSEYNSRNRYRNKYENSSVATDRFVVGSKLLLVNTQEALHWLIK
jgi:hypothetical protein